jgi:DNA-binding transcriptional regulator GbsR (MarR family)
MGDQGLQEHTGRLVAAIGQLGAELGISRVAVQIYALLYLSEEEVSLDEISESLRISKATASVNARELERWGAVRRVWLEGSRKDFYTANRDTLGVVLRALRDGLRRRLGHLDGPLAEARGDLQQLARKGGTREERGRARKALARVEEVSGMLASANDLLDAFGGEAGARRLLPALLSLAKARRS